MPPADPPPSPSPAVLHKLVITVCQSKEPLTYTANCAGLVLAVYLGLATFGASETSRPFCFGAAIFGSLWLHVAGLLVSSYGVHKHTCEAQKPAVLPNSETGLRKYINKNVAFCTMVVIPCAFAGLLLGNAHLLLTTKVFVCLWLACKVMDYGYTSEQAGWVLSPLLFFALWKASMLVSARPDLVPVMMRI